MREPAPSKEAAEKHARSKIAELTAGVAHISPLTSRQAAVVKDATDILRSINVPLPEAVRQFAEAFKIFAGQGSVMDAAKHRMRNLEQLTIPKKKHPEVVTEFLEYIKTTGFSQQYMRDSRARLLRAEAAFDVNIGDIPASAISAWLSSRTISPRTFNNDSNALITLFNFTKRRGYLPEDQRTAPERIEKPKEVGGEIQILTPEQYAMGNSPRKLFQNYRRLVTKKQVSNWFSVLPKRILNPATQRVKLHYQQLIAETSC